MADMPSLLAIVPIFNESDGLEEFNTSLRSQAEHLPPGWTLDVLYIDDGSTDRTADILADLCERDPETQYISLSRNFGHQAALWAGLEAADADAVVVMDGDGQHPVTLIPRMLHLHANGVDIVRTVRIDGVEAGAAWKRWLSARFHDLWAALSQTAVPHNTTEFALFGRHVLEALQRHQEVHRYLRGLLTLVGFTSAVLPVSMNPRKHGQSKYSLRQQIRLASDGIFSFSTAPLRLGLVLGGIFLVIAAAELSAVVWRLLQQAVFPSGWTSLMVITTLGFGSTMVLLGLLGVYIGKIFEQVKNRPVYILRHNHHGKRRRTPASSVILEHTRKTTQISRI